VADGKPPKRCLEGSDSRGLELSALAARYSGISVFRTLLARARRDSHV
jgi:hypothetical protein